MLCASLILFFLKLNAGILGGQELYIRRKRLLNCVVTLQHLKMSYSRSYVKATM